MLMVPVFAQSSGESAIEEVSALVSEHAIEQAKAPSLEVGHWEPAALATEEIAASEPVDSNAEPMLEQGAALNICSFNHMNCMMIHNNRPYCDALEDDCILDCYFYADDTSAC